MKLTRIQLYFIGLFLLMLPLIIYKLVWIDRSVVTTGVVLDIYDTRRWGNTYPRIQFSTKEEVITFSGHYNSDYEPGDSVKIRYIADDPLSHHIDSFWNLWVRIFIVNGIIFIFWSFLFVRQVIVGKRFLVTGKGIRSF